MTGQFVRRIGFSAYETPEALENSIALVRRMSCDRVMLFDSRGHIEPAHLDREEILRRAEVMKAAVCAFRKAGIGVGINNLATIGMNFSPPRKHPLPFQNLVDFDGKVFTECFCPLDSGFQDHLRFQFGTWASVGPDEVWVDDDFRYKTGASQCFCPLHLARFERITDQSWTREELLAAITADGLLPNDLARRWAQMQHDGLIELAQAITRGVLEENPRVRIAFMGMTMKGPAYGTETLRRIGRTFCPEGPVLIRPEYGAMTDEHRAGWNAYMTRWCTQRAFGDDFEAWPELETWPLTGFNHGARVVEMKLLWGAMHGFTSSTISVSNEPRMIAAVGRAKRQVAAIGALLDEAPWRARGVSLEMAENTVGLRPKPGLIALEFEPPAVLMRLGIPLWPDGGCGRILVSNSPPSRQGELTRFAEEGLILDRAAFEHLAALDRDDLLGGARSRPMNGIPVRERYSDDARNGGAAGNVMSMELAIPVRPTLQGFDLPGGDEFTGLSCLEDADGKRLSAGVWTRQWSGGRLVVLPFSLQETASRNAILNPDRQGQLVSLLSWAAAQPLPVRVEGFPDMAAVYRDTANRRRILIGLANFSLDDAEDFALVVPAIPGGIAVVLRVLDRGARWRETPLAADAGGVLRPGKRVTVPAQSVRAIELRIVAE